MKKLIMNIKVTNGGNARALRVWRRDDDSLQYYLKSPVSSIDFSIENLQLTEPLPIWQTGTTGELVDELKRVINKSKAARFAGVEISPQEWKS